MGDFLDKASAIWKALDDMAEKSPEAYANFIETQLQEGSELFLKGSSSDSIQKPDKKEKANPVEGLLQKMAGMNLSPSNTGSKPKKKDTNSDGPLTDLENLDRGDNTRTTLLDHDIGGSLLASIVKVKDDDEDDIADGPIQLLPSAVPKSQVKGISKKRPLIQEL